ncbi:MAG: hypothetical protein HY644_04460 [Acidobacteria bacterium]|nr:hypothetical protein [Acidobacteriota bacterium]
MSILNRSSLDTWTVPGPRLPGVVQWLTDEVWTASRFVSSGSSPARYLESGEKLVHDREVLFSAAASSIFRELAASPPESRTVASFFSRFPDGAAIVFDGCSLRELPRLLELAARSRRPVIEAGVSRAAVPSETDYFVSDGLGLGLPRLGPSQLTSRRELRSRNIGYYYFGKQNTTHQISHEGGPLLLWSCFPDRMFMDSAATSSALFDRIWDTLEFVWRNTVQAVSPTSTVLVTSDHGYIFLGAGLSDRRLDGSDTILEGKRFREFAEEETLPEPGPGLWVDERRRIGILAGRCHNHAKGTSAIQSLYRHGGLTLMEVLTPCLLLGPVEGGQT